MSMHISSGRRPDHIALAAAVAALSLGLLMTPAHAGVSAAEAAKLKTELMPLGGERAGNKEGTIPAWTGGLTKPVAGFVNGGRRPDPFAGEKPLYSITAKNMAQYADKLAEGTKLLLTKYPDTYRIDVYPTRRTAAAPQWVYDNTAKNAVSGSFVAAGYGNIPTGVWAGIPFPIPKTGEEVMWNHLLRWRAPAEHHLATAYVATSDGRHILVQASDNDVALPYYENNAQAKATGEYWLIRNATTGPAIRAGEANTVRFNLDQEKTQAWLYLTGQRRVRKLPNPCCDTPTPYSSGVGTFDESEVFAGRMDNFDWKLVGKKEMLIPYNANGFFVPTKDTDVLMPKHLNPDHVRWELHRVWVVDAELKPGRRHVMAKTRYYLDEDTWSAVLGDRYDARGQLARQVFTLPMTFPDIPATYSLPFGTYDFVAGTMFVLNLMNEKSKQMEIVPKHSDVTFTPEGMSGDSLR